MKKVVLVLTSVCILFIGVLSYYLFFNNHVEIVLKGNSPLKINVFEQYNDEGIILKNNNKIIDNNKYTLKKTSNLNTNIIGNYEIVYDIKYKHKDYQLKRNIEVVDTISPTIDTNTDTVNKDYCTKKISTKLEYTAKDNYDGDLTSNIKVTEEENKIILTVEDSSHNVTTKEIKINQTDKPKNKFTLNGNSKVYITLNNSYQEAGAKYTDGCGNRIKKKINITGEVNTNKIGTYKITYEVEGEKTLTRTVIVSEKKSSSSSSKKIIYLTFDDGPGYYTNKILNTLDKYNVKATFFVTRQFPSYISLIKTEYEKGHAIGVHTYTHKYSIYTSVDTYLDDFNKINDVIKDYTGSYARIFRFPGGSSNTVSKSYNRGIMTVLAKKMQEDGYVYFDWNVSSGDASGARSAKIYNNVINGVKKCSKCVVLMHDIKGTTANALDNILNTLTKEGYEFATLNENSITVHHSINN